MSMSECPSPSPGGGLHGHPRRKPSTVIPSIQMCGRPLHISTDDFVFPGALSVFLRSVWVIVSAVATHRYGSSTVYCETSGNHLTVYLSVALGLTSVVGVLDGITAYASSRGAISDVYARRSVPRLLLLRIILAVPEVGWLLVGTVWSWTEDYSGPSCRTKDLKLVRTAVILAWVFFVVMSLFGLVMINWLGSSRLSKNSRDDTQSSRQGAWMRLCGLCCCCSRSDGKSRAMQRVAVDEVTRLLAWFFDNSIVPTDIAAGLMLVADKQKRQMIEEDQAEAGGQGTPAGGYGPCTAWRSTSAGGDITFPCSLIGEIRLHDDEINRAAFEQVAHFMKFALGPYGWPFMIFEGPVRGCCMLIPNCRCCIECQPRREDGPVIESDCPCSQCNTAAMLSWSGIEYDDIVYATYEQDFEVLPFVVAVDRSHEAVVVTIRGTLSLEDALVDMYAEQEDIPGKPGLTAHRGMLDSATNIKTKIQKAGNPIKHAFDKASAQGLNCDLVIVGHSLGAGVAALLSILYREDYPNLRCYSYSPPGALMNEACTRYSQQFTVSVILGDDIVGRISVPSMSALAADVHRALAETKHSKSEIFCITCSSILFPCLPCCQTLAVDVESAALHQATTPAMDSEAAPILGSSARSLLEPTLPARGDSNRDNKADARRCDRKKYPLVYPPGRVMHLVEMKEASCADSLWSPQWIPFNGVATIAVNSRIVKDHVPHRVRDALQQLYDACA